MCSDHSIIARTPFLAFTCLKTANNENKNACMLKLTVTLIGDARNLF
jgi:hypothetical protein